MGVTSIIGVYLGAAKWGMVFFTGFGCQCWLAGRIVGSWRLKCPAKAGIGASGRSYLPVAYGSAAVLTMGLFGPLYYALQLESKLFRTELSSKD